MVNINSKLLHAYNQNDPPFVACLAILEWYHTFPTLWNIYIEEISIKSDGKKMKSDNIW